MSFFDDWEAIPLENDPNAANAATRLLNYSKTLPEQPLNLGQGLRLEQGYESPSQWLSHKASNVLDALGARRDFRDSLSGGLGNLAALLPSESAYNAGKALGKQDYVRAGIEGLGAVTGPEGYMLHLAPAMVLGASARAVDRKALELAQEADRLKDLPRQAAQAPVLDKKGIYDATGWYKGPEGGWRTLLDDSQAQVLEPNLTGQVSLPDYYHHPELYKNYPELHNVAVEPLPYFGRKNLGGTYTGIGEPGSPFAPPKIKVNPDLSPALQKEYVGHEIQHAIQDIEGWHSGGQPGQAPPIYDHPAVQKLVDERDQLLQDAAKRNASDPNYAGSEDEARDLRKLNRYHENIDRVASIKGYEHIYGEAESNLAGSHAYKPLSEIGGYPWEKLGGLDPVDQNKLVYPPPKTGWANYPTRIADPLERVLAGADMSSNAWAQNLHHDVDRARWLLETGAFGENHELWKVLNDSLPNAKAQAEAPGARPELVKNYQTLSAALDSLHEGLGPEAATKLEQSLRLPSKGDIDEWRSQAFRLQQLHNAPQGRADSRLPPSDRLTELQGRSFQDLSPRERGNLAQYEYALQRHGDDFLQQQAKYDFAMQRLGAKDSATRKYLTDNEASVKQQIIDAYKANHERLIQEARQHYGDLAVQHYGMEPQLPTVAKDPNAPEIIAANPEEALTHGSIDIKRFTSPPTVEHLDTILNAQRGIEDKQADAIFGPDAEEAKRLMRRRGYSERLDDLVQKYGQKAEGLVYGSHGYPIINRDELEALRDHLSNVEFAVDNAAKGRPSDLHKELAWLAPKLPEISMDMAKHTPDQRQAVLGLSRLLQYAKSKNVDMQEALRGAVNYTGKRVRGDASDATVLLGKLADYVRKYGAQ